MMKDMPMMDKKKNGYDKYELDHALSCLLEAEEIKADKKMMKALQPLLNKKVQAISSLDELRSAAQNSAMQDSTED